MLNKLRTSHVVRSGSFLINITKGPRGQHKQITGYEHVWQDVCVCRGAQCVKRPEKQLFIFTRKPRPGEDKHDIMQFYLLNGWLLPSMWRWFGRANRAEKLKVDDLDVGRSMWAPLKFSGIVIERLANLHFIQNISDSSVNTKAWNRIEACCGGRHGGLGHICTFHNSLVQNAYLVNSLDCRVML